MSNYIIASLLPYFSWIIDVTCSEYTPMLSIIRYQGDSMIQMQAIVVEPIPISPLYSIPAGAQMKAGTHVLHNLIPLLIAYALILSWPMSLVRERLIALCMMAPILIVIMGLSTPYLLAGHIEVLYQNLANQHGITREVPFLLHWMIFIETGGVWLLPIAGAGLSLYLARLMISRRSS